MRPSIICWTIVCVVVVPQSLCIDARGDEDNQIATWPNETNTGVRSGVSLKPSGGFVVTEADTVISGLDIQGGVHIKAPNVTLIDSRVTSASFYIVRIEPGITGAVIQNCEIDGTGEANDGSYGIVGQGTFIANNIYNVENGIGVSGADTLIRDNYIHDLRASGSPHYDGIQVDGGNSNITIQHNTVINSYTQTSAVMIDNYFGPVLNVAVENNVLIGGGYTVYADGQFNGGSIVGVSFTNNRLGKGKWGYRSFVRNTPAWRGNVDHFSGRYLGAR
ncbi:right-handed parallel beta-helix repeat-containing protein [Bradyrhizobium vignae]|uniref:right-handed parallel beta-helix repeat-containing protein n=1 Tax=Bradyrhizobium vignae TaxID=1549949 RepID=UPI00100AC4D6|nr:right-handed parallel beta-helix repeat-containing protein [Bradyrhizobium vignae]RXG91476.1 right-handed parallel beta-helix repeat-containing protein [Bradyrhizobium vignae]